ncbi:MAG: undecaprenyl-phosphate glucose phosphotransferase, partial [Motiliproteus sp.]|nr:undecaprenyl-phosphate glucose phosphotransferase [Motiliproteus sp.]
MKYTGFLKEHSNVIMWVLKSLDCSVLLITALVAKGVATDIWTLDIHYTIALVIAVLASFTIYPFFSIYRAWRGSTKMEELRSIFLGWSCLFAVLALLAVLTKSSEIYSRLWFGSWYISGFVTIVLGRFAVRKVLSLIREKGFNTRQVVIIGVSELGQRVAHTIQRENWTGLNVEGFFDDQAPGNESENSELPLLGCIESCPDYVKDNKIEQVWICLPLSREKEMRKLFASLDDTVVDLRFVPDIFGFQLLNHSVSEIAGIPVIDLSSSPMEGVHRLVKAV